MPPVAARQFWSIMGYDEEILNETDARVASGGRKDKVDPNTSEDERDEVSIVGLLKPLWRHRRLLVVTTLAMTALAVLLSAVSYWRQPVRWTASMEFRPTFEGADQGKYPNKLPFAPSDIIDASVLDQVFDTNKIQDFCARNDFRSAFFIEQRSSELQLIDSDYQSRLADKGLTLVDRQRLMDEYRARRASAPLQYGVTFIRPVACRTLPAAVAIKMLDDVLLTWANDAESKRGVLKQRVKVLTSNVLDVATGGRQSLFVRVNLVWTNIDRVIRNIAEVEALPGAELVRFGEQRVSLAEVRARMEDLQHAQVESLMTSVGAEHDRDSVRWVEDALATATSQQQVAQNRARANLDALREYSGVAPQPNPQRGETQRPQGAADVQSLTPQIDRTFIDRILEMSAPNTMFRQELTRAMVKASLEAVESESVVNHYKQLLAELKSGGSSSSVAEVDSRLSAIVTEGKDLIRQFDGLYDEWSRVAFRAGPAMYRTERPGAVEAVRPFSLTSYATTIALVFFVTLLIAVLAALVHTRLWPALVAGK